MAKKPDTKFGNKVRDRRLALGLTQLDIAKAVNVEQVAVSNWELGQNKPVRKYRKPLCDVLRLDYKDLFPEGS